MSTRTDPLPAPFVGRAAELRQLHDFLSSVMSTRRPEVVLVQGDIGVGKTSLVEHFLSGIPRQDDQGRVLLIGRAKCALESGGSGLIPFSQLLTSLLNESEQRRIRPEGVVEFLRGGRGVLERNGAGVAGHPFARDIQPSACHRRHDH
jgi:predicted ATPase